MKENGLLEIIAAHRTLADLDEIQNKYSIPSAFSMYLEKIL